MPYVFFVLAILLYAGFKLDLRTKCIQNFNNNTVLYGFEMSCAVNHQKHDLFTYLFTDFRMNNS